MSVKDAVAQRIKGLCGDAEKENGQNYQYGHNTFHGCRFEFVQRY